VGSGCGELVGAKGALSGHVAVLISTKVHARKGLWQKQFCFPSISTPAALSLKLYKGSLEIGVMASTSKAPANLVYSLPQVSASTVANSASLLRIVALCLISATAIASRLFAVVTFESVIHELWVFFLKLLSGVWKLTTALSRF